jgi:hypothetical protein
VEHQGAPVLQVKIVEDTPEVRNPEALKAGVAASLVQAPPILLTSGTLVKASKAMTTDDEDEIALEV